MCHFNSFLSRHFSDAKDVNCVCVIIDAVVNVDAEIVFISWDLSALRAEQFV